MKHYYFLLILVLTTTITFGQTTAISSSNAIHFDGTNDYLRAETMPPTTAQYTVMTWLKLEGGGTQTISSWGSDSSNIGWIFRIQAQKLWTNPSNIPYSGDTIIPLDTWTHVALAVNGNNFKFYVNGVLDGSFTQNPYGTTGIDNFTVARMIYGGTLYFPFNGKMDEFSLWDVQLSEASIANHRQNGYTGSESGLVLYYNFNQGTAGADNTAITTVSDTTTNNYAATIIDMSLTEEDNSNFVLWNSPTLSINSFDYNNKLSIYPNPSNDFINVKGLTNVENYILYNNLGQKLKKETISKNEKIDIKNLNNGFYFLKFDNGNTIQFIKK